MTVKSNYQYQGIGSKLLKIAKKLYDNLFGVIVIDPQDEKFNPEIHEAVSMQELEDVEPGSVISVMQKGYELNGRLVRPAMVMVAK